MVAAPAAVTMVWKWLYNNQYGLINHFLNSIGLDSVNWIDDPKVAMISIAIIGIWSNSRIQYGSSSCRSAGDTERLL